MPTKICFYCNCQHVNPITAKVCARCGRELLEDAEVTGRAIVECFWKCGHQNPLRATFCANCGRAFSGDVENLQGCPIYSEGTTIVVDVYYSDHDDLLSEQDNATEDRLEDRLKACIENRLRNFGIRINKKASSCLMLIVHVDKQVLKPRREVVLVRLQMEFKERLLRPNTDKVTYGITWSKQFTWAENTDDMDEFDFPSLVEQEFTDRFAECVKTASGRNRPHPDALLDADDIQSAVTFYQNYGPERRTGGDDPTA